MTHDRNKPIDVVVILKDGGHVPVDLRLIGIENDFHIWEPVIEGDITKLMPNIMRIDAKYWPLTSAIRFPQEDSLGEDWGKAIATNSPCVARYEAGH